MKSVYKCSGGKRRRLPVYLFNNHFIQSNNPAAHVKRDSKNVSIVAGRLRTSIMWPARKPDEDVRASRSYHNIRRSQHDIMASRVLLYTVVHVFLALCYPSQYQISFHFNVKHYIALPYGLSDTQTHLFVLYKYKRLIELLKEGLTEEQCNNNNIIVSFV